MTNLSHSRKDVIGRHEATAVAGENMLLQLERLSGLSPALSRSILEEGFGTLLANATTGYREWCLQALAVLMAIGDAGDQSELYLKAALAHGATVDEISDLVNITYLYAGAPRSVTAARRMVAYFGDTNQGQPQQIAEHIIQLSDHQTLAWDSHGQGLAGKSVPMILIHALDMDHRFWREVYPELAKKGRTIAYDIRGHGHARGAPPTTSLDQLADDVRHLMDRLAIPEADVYGASYGGAIAQHVALNMPDRVRSLALIAMFAKAPREELAERATDAEQHGMEAQVARSIIRWFLPATIAEDPWMVRYARNCVRRARVVEWAAAWRTMSQLDVSTRAGSLDVPVLVLSGKQDLSSTPEMMQSTADVYKRAQFQAIDPGTHMMVMEQAPAVATALTSFRDKIEGASRLARVA